MKETAVRRRSKEQIKEEKRQAAQKEAEVKAKLEEHEVMAERIYQMEMQLAEQESIQAQVNQLFQSGILADDGQGNIGIAQ